MWSVGVVLYEAAALKLPFTGESLDELASKVALGEYEELPRSIPSDYRTIVHSLLQVNPRVRPSCSQILNYSAVAKRSIPLVNIPNEVLLDPIVLLGSINIGLVKFPDARYRDDRSLPYHRSTLSNPVIKGKITLRNHSFFEKTESRNHRKLLYLEEQPLHGAGFKLLNNLQNELLRRKPQYPLKAIRLQTFPSLPH